MSARDELEALLVANGGQRNIAPAILAAGYRKPRTITTAEELDALAVRSVLLTHGNKFGPLAVQKLSNGEPAGLDYLSVGLAMGYSSGEIHLPATVIHEPTA